MVMSSYFHGYNCFSSVLGESLKILKKEEYLKFISLRWTFDYCRAMEDDNLWFIGACVEPYDYLLQYDLNKFCGIEIKEVIPEIDKINRELRNELSENGFQLTMVDFYYMKSIDWNRMERFGFYPRHLPHFIVVTELTENGIRYIDPQYRFTGQMKMDEFTLARDSKVCNIEINNRYFRFINKNKNENKDDYVKYQLERYLKNKHINKISMFASDVMEIYIKEQDRNNIEWLFNTYLSLESIVDMRVDFSRNILNLNEFQKVELKKVIEIWIKIRKLFLNMYKKPNLRSVESIQEAKAMLLDVEKTENRFIEDYLKNYEEDNIYAKK